jgi:mono/diheme cytochrome c family protein
MPVVFAGLLGVSSPAMSFETTLALTNAPEPGGSAGRNRYLQVCASCHGMSGEGTRVEWPSVGPALKGNPFVKSAPNAAIAKVIRSGRNGRQRLYHDTYPNMPAFGMEVVPDVDELIAYLKGDLQK